MRTVVEGGNVTVELAKAELRWSRTWDAWEAITWIVVRDPNQGAPLTESGITRSYTLDGVRSAGWPTVTIVYEIQPQRIVVHDAKFADAPYPQSGRA